MFESADNFFYEKINNYFKKNNIKVNDYSKVYLISLLKKFITADEIKYSTLFDIYKKCIEGQQAADFQYLGDHSLYIAGVFPDSLNRSLVDVNYYIQMGQLGYGQAASMSSNNETRNLYMNMANNFKVFMNSFYSVGQESFVQDKMALYNRYLLTENPEIYRDLVKSGAIPAIKY